MSEEGQDIKALEKELEQFKKEKEAIRDLVGQIGGSSSSKFDKMMNIFFITIIAFLFLQDILEHVFHIKTFIPSIFSIQLGVLLVSAKIIWMMHKTAKVDHFQFWILNSIEFRLNDISKQIRKLNKKK